ncbi:hypothetical protein BDW74DRAFT_47630 [Aspergillus multicolor]|uniref:uncharacterized protein n=1 Tax=Aspergillus multicolor TaxID=41759 RepID=UPI003CCD2610
MLYSSHCEQKEPGCEHTLVKKELTKHINIWDNGIEVHNNILAGTTPSPLVDTDRMFGSIDHSSNRADLTSRHCQDCVRSGGFVRGSYISDMDPGSRREAWVRKHWQVLRKKNMVSCR